jgi:hypothetical protein
MTLSRWIQRTRGRDPRTLEEEPAEKAGGEYRGAESHNNPNRPSRQDTWQEINISLIRKSGKSKAEL